MYDRCCHIDSRAPNDCQSSVCDRSGVSCLYFSVCQWRDSSGVVFVEDYVYQQIPGIRTGRYGPKCTSWYNSEALTVTVYNHNIIFFLKFHDNAICTASANLLHSNRFGLGTSGMSYDLIFFQLLQCFATEEELLCSFQQYVYGVTRKLGLIFVVCWL